VLIFAEKTIIGKEFTKKGTIGLFLSYCRDGKIIHPIKSALFNRYLMIPFANPSV